MRVSFRLFCGVSSGKGFFRFVRVVKLVGCSFILLGVIIVIVLGKFFNKINIEKVKLVCGNKVD